MRRTAILLALPVALANFAAAQDAAISIPHFVEETGSSGVNHTYTGEWEYMVGGGVASFDCNGDGYDELFLAGGAAPSRLYLNKAKRGAPLQFEETLANLEIDKVIGAYPLDIDGDLNMDLVVLRSGENMIMRGRGDCKFSKANDDWNFVGGDAWSTAFAATWEKNAAWPTLAIGNYIDRQQELSPWGSCTDNWLHRPAETGDKFASPQPMKPSFCPLSMMFTDWNKSGTPSLRMSNDREYYEGGQEQMWHVAPGQAPRLYTESEGWKFLRIWGMGIASYDLDGNGYPEYFLTSMADNKLQTLAAIPENGTPPATFKDVAFAKGVTAHRPYMGEDLRPSTAWHTQFEDVNNDGLVDLFVAKGNVAKMPDFAQRDPNNLLMQGADGKFTEAGMNAGVASVASSRGAALADFNLDGLLDLVVVNQGTPTQTWRNTSADAGQWIQFKLKHDSANRNAIGAIVEIKLGDKILRREITSGGGHASGQNGWWHFGIGDFKQTEMRVIWPHGEMGAWMPVTSNQFYLLAQGKPAQTWLPK